MHNISKARWITRWESGKTGDAWTATEIQSNLHLWIHCFFVCMCIYKTKRMTRWESAKTGGAWTATETRSTLPLWIRGFSHISYICKAKNKSARAIWKIPAPLLGKGWRPPALEGRARARARARALSTTANHGISLFFKGNPRFDQGKSCSVPRVWQLCKISARAVPVLKRYDQRKFMKNLFSLKFIGHVKKKQISRPTVFGIQAWVPILILNHGHIKSAIFWTFSAPADFSRCTSYSGIHCGPPQGQNLTNRTIQRTEICIITSKRRFKDQRQRPFQRAAVIQKAARHPL